LAQAMQDASKREDYEGAALLRDRIAALTSIQAQQDINVKNVGDADVIGIYRDESRTCVQVFFFRAGQNFGNRAYFPRHDAEESDQNILGAFMAQFYENKPVPREIIVSIDPTERLLLEEAFSVRSGASVEIIVPQKGVRRRLADFAIKNARQALAQDTLRLTGEKEILQKLTSVFNLEDAPERIEIFDNSHVSGTNMVGVMVVAGPEGFRKNAYRKFNIRDAKPGDDYGMMREVMTRRFKRAESDGPDTESAEKNWPDLLLIDGGLGQLNAVREILNELGIEESVQVMSIAKGPDRNAGRETFFMQAREPFTLPPQDPVLHYLQRLRDEAHRFAIGAHRVRRSKGIESSPLDGVPGIGPKRRKALLLHFGSGAEVTRAGVADLMKVEGISEAVAERIYNHFHQEN